MLNFFEGWDDWEINEYYRNTERSLFDTFGHSYWDINFTYDIFEYYRIEHEA